MATMREYRRQLQALSTLLNVIQASCLFNKRTVPSCLCTLDKQAAGETSKPRALVEKNIVEEAQEDYSDNERSYQRFVGRVSITDSFPRDL